MKDEQENASRRLFVLHDSVFQAICPRGAARSARHPVKVEIVGSNPIGGAEWIENARYSIWQSDHDHRSGGARTLVQYGFVGQRLDQHEIQNRKSKIGKGSGRTLSRAWEVARGRPKKKSRASTQARLRIGEIDSKNAVPFFVRRRT